MDWLMRGRRREQRRAYYRYQCRLPMEERLMDGEEQIWMKEQGMLVVDDMLPVHTSTVLNISGGGMLFAGTYKYEAGDMVYGRFHFGRDYRLCMRILENSRTEEQTGEYQSRAEFVGMEQREREELIRYIFARERKDRKLELE